MTRSSRSRPGRSGRAAAGDGAADAGGPVVATRRRSLASIDPDEAVADFRLGCLSRALDDREILLQKQSRVFFQISGAGHEVLGTALARALRPGIDWFFPYYRDRALCLGLGVTPLAMLQQAVGAADDPASHGRQMPCHWGDRDRHIVTQSSPTGSQCLPAVGCAEASRYIANRPGLAAQGCTATGDEVVHVSLGEGACSEGEFWESLNTACRLHLPVLFVVADNGYAISVRAADQAPAPVAEMVRGFRGLAVSKVDGWDYAACRAVTSAAVARVRAGQGPGLLHARVTRPYSHSSADAQAKYRTAAELAGEAVHDPLVVLGSQLVTAGILTAAEVDGIRAAATAEVAAAADTALAGNRPDPLQVREHLTAKAGAPPDTDGRTCGGRSGAGGNRAAAAPGDGAAAPTCGQPTCDQPAAGEPLVMADAIRAALHELLQADERVRVFGEDVADADDPVLHQVEGKGGVFGVTRGLQRAFGSARCYNTPLAEANIVGRGVGQALRGLRPVAEIQFFDYIWPAMQQLRSEMATVRWRSAGAFSCPLVVRVAIGGYLTGGAIWHSQCGESIFAHTPGLQVAFPSRAADAVRLLRTAVTGEDPVLFLEHKHLYRQRDLADPMPPPGDALPFGRAAVVRPGTDLTVVTWGATVRLALQAATALQGEGASVEVVDLRTIVPWDREAVAASVARTGRLLVVHEDVLTAGFGAEVAAWVGEHAFWSLDAPVARVAAPDVWVPYAPELERAVLPQVADIVDGARRVLGA